MTSLYNIILYYPGLLQPYILLVGYPRKYLEEEGGGL